MCGRFQLNANHESEALLDALSASGEVRYCADIAPASRISIVIDEGEQGRSLVDATWWLLLDEKTLKPSYRYSSFNSRSDKLSQPRAIAYRPFRESRCIIPASAFIEGLGDKKTYHQLELEGQAIAFGGVFRHWQHQETGEEQYSASIITLPPSPKWQNIHPKSCPLMLDFTNQSLMSQWLDPGFSDVAAFSALLAAETNSEIQKPQRVTPIGKPSQWNPIGESYLLH